ncbi:MAG TPA: hypothetical protein VF204_10045 [Streptosporangiaceae bacterium]
MTAAAGSPPGTASGPIVLRRPRSVLYCAVLAAVLIPLFFWIPMAHGTLKGMAGGGAIGALLGGILVARFRYQIGSGQLTVTQLYSRRQSVDLTRLASVSAPGRAQSFWRSSYARGWLELRDHRGSVARLNFYGTGPAQRQRLLAALGPYVMAEGVSRTGLVTEALTGELWWPRPRR